MVQANQKQQRVAAQQFAKDWAGRGYEKGDTHTFWLDLLRNVVGLTGVSAKCKFEYRAANGGFIDCYIPDCKTIIEQKALGVDLDKPEERQNRMVTPYQQALSYAESFPLSQQPRFIIVSNFGTFRIHDRDKRAAETDYVEFSLDSLSDHFSQFGFMVDPKHSRSALEEQVSMRAGELIGRLHKELLTCYISTESKESQHSLNVLCVRLVFCLYCEDAGLFEKDALLNYLRGVPAKGIRDALKKLFRALNTPKEQRDPYDESVKRFPYVNGGLFAEEVEIPNFTENLKHVLLFDVSQQTDWSKVSPTIFGGIFESTLNPEVRRSGGMHYTSPENIHKVIDPLFLDDLKEELNALLLDNDITTAARKKKLQKFREKLGNMRFFDPACGSGNFLTETYACLRELEDDVLNALNDGQVVISFGSDLDNNQRVSLDQFYGIEINDFAVRVAKTALWIAQLQADRTSESVFNVEIERFPLTDAANITQGNALQMDWNAVLPASECDFIMGNPPFYGARNQAKEQKADIAAVFHNAKNCGNIDYVAGWYMKAAEYMADNPIRCAYVSTNSICQGEQVANIWKPIYDLGMRIDFAHNTFRWKNEATGQAHVFCVIVGFSKNGLTDDKGKGKGLPDSSLKTRKCRLFYHETPDDEAVELAPANINAYLRDAPDVFFWNRSRPLCDVPEIGIGNKPIDVGHYLFKEDEMAAFLAKEPQAQPFFHPWLGSDEFINGKKRFVLWLGDATPAQIKQLPCCKQRILAVRDFRLASKSAPTRKLAERPQHFHVENMPAGTSILIPRVSSERRRYIPLGFIGPDTFCSDAVLMIPNATLYHFGVLHSQFHNAWMRVVAGRLKSDYRYSGGVVYNNFVWPNPTSAQRVAIERCAQQVLDAREPYMQEGSTMADMYDPENSFLYPDLIAAHNALDAAVEAAYGVSFHGDEQAIVAHLFELYAQKG